MFDLSWLQIDNHRSLRGWLLVSQHNNSLPFTLSVKVCTIERNNSWMTPLYLSDSLSPFIGKTAFPRNNAWQFIVHMILASNPVSTQNRWNTEFETLLIWHMLRATRACRRHVLYMCTVYECFRWLIGLDMRHVTTCEWNWNFVFPQLLQFNFHQESPVLAFFWAIDI